VVGWRSLEDRRRDARLTMLYKIDHERFVRWQGVPISDSSWEERHLPDVNPTVWYLIGIVVVFLLVCRGGLSWRWQLVRGRSCRAW
jgi:hypothetical protein